jgi:succinyl-CoA synthetase beta subunit
MNIHEYQAKEILKKYNVKIGEGIYADSPESAVAAAKKLNELTGTDIYVVKAQIHAGGRGKGKFVGTEHRGVMIAKSLDEVKQQATQMLGNTLVTIQTGPSGKVVNRLLIAANVYQKGESELKELYLSILLDRGTGRDVIIASTEGGMDIEDVAHNTPHLITKEFIDPAVGFQGFQARKIAFGLGLSGKAFMQK